MSKMWEVNLLTKKKRNLASPKKSHKGFYQKKLTTLPYNKEINFYPNSIILLDTRANELDNGYGETYES